jgi:hypothetical protein
VDEVGTARMAAAYQRVSTVAEAVDQLVEHVVQQEAGTLDALVRRVEKYLDESDQIEDFELSRLALRIPVLLYRLSEGTTRASLAAEVAKLVVERAKAEALVVAEGKTAADRASWASLHTESESIAATAAKHVEKKLKIKVEAARDLYEGVKKIMTSRDRDKEVFRYMKEAKGL